MNKITIVRVMVIVMMILESGVLIIGLYIMMIMKIFLQVFK